MPLQVFRVLPAPPPNDGGHEWWYGDFSHIFGFLGVVFFFTLKDTLQLTKKSDFRQLKQCYCFCLCTGGQPHNASQHIHVCIITLSWVRDFWGRAAILNKPNKTEHLPFCVFALSQTFDISIRLSLYKAVVEHVICIYLWPVQWSVQLSQHCYSAKKNIAIIKQKKSLSVSGTKCSITEHTPSLYFGWTAYCIPSLWLRNSGTGAIHTGWKKEMKADSRPCSLP